MRILLTTDTGGGVWTYAIQLADELSRNGVQVVLATMGEPLRLQQRRDAHSISGLTLHESTYQLGWMDEPWNEAKEAGEWLIYLERLTRPDVIHLNHIAHCSMPFKTPTLVVAHSCTLAWHRAVKQTDVPNHWQSHQAAARHGLSCAQTIVVPTHAECDTLTAAYGPLRRVMVIPHGRRQFTSDVHSKWPFVLCAGRPSDEAHNVSLLKDVADYLSWPVWLAGEVPLTHNQTRRNRGNAHILGHLPFSELSRWFSRAAIYCLPAKYEPFGMGILEAGLCGCSLVLGDIASLREIWGNAALYVPPDDREALIATVEDLIQRPELREKYGTLARERAIKYSPERMTAAYLSLYNDLAQPASYELPLRKTAFAS